MISSACDPTSEQLDAGDQELGFGVFDGFLPILGETEVATEPCEGAFNHPAPGQQNEALGGIRALDDFQGPLSDLSQRPRSFGPA